MLCNPLWYGDVVSGHTGWFRNDLCAVARTMEILGERWNFLVLREAFLGTRRFDDFQRGIGVARNILSDRLKTLVDAGILERRQYQDRPPRFEYRLTEAGLDLYPTMVALMQWGDRHLPNPDGPSLVLEHRTCGHETSPVMVCDRCGEPVRARDVRAKPGPGALAAMRAASS